MRLPCLAMVFDQASLIVTDTTSADRAPAATDLRLLRSSVCQLLGGAG